MTKTKLLFIILILAAGSLLSACRGRGGVGSSWPGISVEDDLAYVASGLNVYSVQLTNGIQRDKYPEEPLNGSTNFYAPLVALDQDRYLAGSYKNSIYTLDTSSGTMSEFFKAPQTFWIASPLVTDLGIFAASSNHILYALDDSGAEMWSFEAKEPFWASPMLDGETLYIASMGHNLYALDADGGGLLWRADLGGTSVATPAMDEDGVLYIGTFESQALAVDSKSGEILWAFDTDGWVWGSPVVYDGTLFITDLDGNVYAVDTETQELDWKYTAKGEISGSVALAEGSLFFYTKTGQIVSLNLDGSVRWTRTIEDGGELGGTPVVAGDLILVSMANSPRLVIAYDVNGSLVWEFAPEN